MYRGLNLMNEEELAEITRLIGVEHPPGSKDILLDIVSGWLARAVKKEGRASEEIERAVLEWTAKSLRIIVPEGTDTNDLERSLRLKIANDALEFLSPGWVLCCALIAVGKKDNISEKLSLMEEAATTAVPSQQARKAKRREWEQLCRRWAGADPSAELDKHMEAVSSQPEMHTEILTLGLSLSLLDGSIGFPVERLYRDICDRLGIERGESDELKSKVNDLYWKHHNAAVPTQSGTEQSVDPIRSATERTVYDAGSLEALAAEARQRLFASLVPMEPKKSGWSKLVGGLSGMNPFFNNKMKNSTDANLLRVVYHTILKQHDAVVAAAHLAHSGIAEVLSEPVEEISESPVAETVPVSAPEPPAPPATPVPSLEDQMVGQKSQPKRVIKLDL